MHRQRLSRTTHVGGGYKVVTKLVTRTQLAQLLDESERPSESWSPGGWDVDSMTIYISKHLSSGKKWETYWHELAHAVHDIALIDRGGIE